MNKLVVLFCCMLALSKHAQSQYHFYYGNIHSHTEYSDGNKDSISSGVSTPGESFAYAKNSYHIDFWGISEHNHYNANNNPGMLLSRYAYGLFQADSSNQDGQFVALFGIEFGTISTGGHVITYGVPGLIGWEDVGGAHNYDIYCNEGDYTSYWSIVNDYPNSFSTLAHPQSGDYQDLLQTAVFNPSADSAIVGSAMRSGNAFSTTTDYSDAPSGLYETQFERALAKGYHTAPSIDHDNHYTTFGRTNKGRTVVLSTELSRDSIIAAFNQRRFYASDDWNTEVTFTANGFVMGSIDTTYTPASVQVSVADADVADGVSSIELFYGIPGSGILPALLYSVNNSNTLNYVHANNPDTTYYYYARITQTDGDMIWTAPIWLHRSNMALASGDLLFNVAAKQNVAAVQWMLNSVEPLVSVELQHSTNGSDFSVIFTQSLNGSESLVSGSYEHADLPAGLHYYRLKMQQANGLSSFTDSKNIQVRNTSLAFTLYPNPAHDYINVSYFSFHSGEAVARIYDAEGRTMGLEIVKLNTGSNLLTFNTSCYSSGTYYLVVQQDHQRLIDTKFTIR